MRRLVQESTGLNPDWFLDIKLFWAKNLNMLSYNNLSNILLEIGSKVLEGNFPFSNYDRKIISSVLQVDSSQTFNIRILIIS